MRLWRAKRCFDERCGRPFTALHNILEHGGRRPEAAIGQLPHAEQWRDGGDGYDIRLIESIVCASIECSLK